MTQPDMFPKHQPVIKRKKSEQTKYKEAMLRKFQTSMNLDTDSQFFKDHFIIATVGDTPDGI